MKKLIPADTVDSDGNVWETTGENIRRGKKEFSESEVKAIVDILYPVGSTYCGDNAFILSVGKWEQISANAGKEILEAGTVMSGVTITAPQIVTSDTTKDEYTVLRIYRRDS
jgi:hypothetical protein